MDDASSPHLARDWIRWAGRGNGLGGEAVDRLMGVLDFLGGLGGGFMHGYQPASVTGRVRHVRRAGWDSTPGVWQVVGGPRIPVTVVMEGKNRFIEGDDLVVPLEALIPLGLLDYPPRPRATAPLGTELAYGFVLRHEAQVVTLMLLRKSDVAVLAILAGWRSPIGMPHGQNAEQILGSSS